MDEFHNFVLRNKENMPEELYDILKYLSSYNRKVLSSPSVINVYSFALKPGGHQPSGTWNFSRMDNARIEFCIYPWH